MYISKLVSIPYSWRIRSLTYVVIAFLFSAQASFSPDNCPKSGHQANVFMDADLLKQSEIYRDFSNAQSCDNPGNPCRDKSICSFKLQNFHLSNMIPCCVKLTNGSSVCQCVIKIPNSIKANQCPGKNLVLVSNQGFNMSGESKFFDETYPICSSLFNSWNFYKPIDHHPCPVIPTTPLPFVKTKGAKVEKIGFQFFRADKFGDYCLNYYIEFLLTCKTIDTFESDDLKLCEKPCNELPYAEIWMDTTAVSFDNPQNSVFTLLTGQPNCEVALTANIQCFSLSNCNPIDEQCCYSKNCMFPFNPDSNTCPCPPTGDNIIMANNGILTCDVILNGNNRFYVFKGIDPPGQFVFNWDLNINGPVVGSDRGIFLFGRGEVIMPIKSGGESLYWLADLELPGSTFQGCLAEIVRTLKTRLPFSLEDLGSDIR